MEWASCSVMAVCACAAATRPCHVADVKVAAMTAKTRIGREPRGAVLIPSIGFMLRLLRALDTKRSHGLRSKLGRGPTFAIAQIKPTGGAAKRLPCGGFPAI